MSSGWLTDILRAVVRAAVVLALWSPACLATDTRGRTPTFRGVPLSEPITIEAQGRLFRLPLGYLETWPYREGVGQVIRRSNLAFAFWMPSRRYPEVEAASNPGFRPREASRQAPAAGDSVVKVRLVQFEASKHPRYISPRRKFENYTSILGKDKFEFRERFGLLEFWMPAGPNAFINYREIDGTQPAVLLDCTKPGDAIPIPLCSGDVHFAQDDLAFFILFSREDIRRWREIVMTARELILSWAVER
jgi:hypothetical protein